MVGSVGSFRANEKDLIGNDNIMFISIEPLFADGNVKTNLTRLSYEIYKFQNVHRYNHAYCTNTCLELFLLLSDLIRTACAMDMLFPFSMHTLMLLYVSTILDRFMW